MIFQEFGEQNRKKILLLHDCWMNADQFDELVPLLSDDHRVITVSLDGLDEIRDVDYPGFRREAEKIATYLKERCENSLDLVFALGELGCGTVSFLLEKHPDVRVSAMILCEPGTKREKSTGHPDLRRARDGFRLAAQAARGRKKGKNRITGRALRKSGCAHTGRIPAGISYETFWNIERDIYLLPRMLECFRINLGVPVLLWYGSDTPASAIPPELARLYPNHSFVTEPGRLADAVTEEPQRLADRIRGFAEDSAGRNTEAKGPEDVKEERKTAEMEEITKDILIGDLVTKYPDSVPVLLNIGMGCLGCSSAQSETLEQAAAVHGYDAEEIADYLNRMIRGEKD